MKLSPQERRQVVAIAECADITLRKYLAGERGQPTITGRIERALKEAGLSHAIRAPGAPASAAQQPNPGG